MSERKLEKLLHLCNNFPINHFFNPQSRRRKNVFNISWNQSLCPKLRIFANFIWFQRRAHVRSWSNKTESVIYLKQLHRQHRHRLWTLYFCFNFPPFFCPNTFLLGSSILNEQINDILCKTKFYTNCFWRLIDGHFENAPIQVMWCDT